MTASITCDGLNAPALNCSARTAVAPVAPAAAYVASTVPDPAALLAASACVLDVTTAAAGPEPGGLIESVMLASGL